MFRKQSGKKSEDIVFLKSCLPKLQAEYRKGYDLIENDVLGWNEELISSDVPITSDEEEHCARLADSSGFDGNLFRFLLPQRSCTLGSLIKNTRKRIEVLPKIIAAIEVRKNTPSTQENNSTDKSSMLIDIHELAQMLNLSESTLRKYNHSNIGLLPATCGGGGKLLWRRTEIEDWIKAGRPNRVEWEKMKGTSK